MRPALFFIAACGSGQPDKERVASGPLTDTGSAVDTAADTGESQAVSYSIEDVGRASIQDHEGVRSSQTHPYSATTFVLDDSGLKISTLSHMWVHPYGSYCLGGTYDEEGECRGGMERESGVLTSPQPTRSMCIDESGGQLILVKANGQRIEIVDTEKDGADPYTYNQVIRRIDLPAQLNASGSYTGPCAVLDDEAAVVLSSAAHQGLAVISIVEEGDPLRMGLLEFDPLAMARPSGALWILDGTHHRVVAIRSADLTEAYSVELGEPAITMAVGEGAKSAWVHLESSRLMHVDMEDRLTSIIELSGDLVSVAADGARDLAWALTVHEGVYTLDLISPAGIEDSRVIDGSVEGLGSITESGDVPVYVSTEDGGLDVSIYAPRAEQIEGEPLYGFIFTTIEEPSDLNMDLPCEGGEVDFARELTLIRHNAARMAALERPVALAITDNFAEKAEACGETGIFDELAEHGFTLGVMLHNRPCFNCTDGAHDANPQVCDRSSPYWAQPASTSACFPDDPEYCGRGDWDCYRDLMTPRIALVDRNIPGGGRFIVGGDRHRMWNHDWIRLYREVERPDTDQVGFDLSMFASAWAFDGVDLGDARGKDLAPWSQADKTAAWRLGDIDHWAQDAPRSDLFYFPGLTWSTVKLGEHQKSGLYMIDFFSSGAPIAYDNEDYEAVYQDLRAAIAQRRPGTLNTWYFHIHDLGTLNFRDVHDEPLMTDPDGDGPEDSVPTETLLEAFIDRIEGRYGPSGEFVWMDPVQMRRMLD